MAELADGVLLSRSGMTRLVDRLEREGLLERDACVSDGRGTFAVLTAKGEELLSRARRTHLDGVRERFLTALHRGRARAARAVLEPGAARAPQISVGPDSDGWVGGGTGRAAVTATRGGRFDECRSRLPPPPSRS